MAKKIKEFTSTPNSDSKTGSGGSLEYYMNEKKRAIFETDLEMAYAQLEYWQEKGVKHKIEKIEQDIEELENILGIEK